MEEDQIIKLFIAEPKESYDLQKHPSGLQGNFTQTSNDFYDDNLSAYAQAVYGQLNRRKNNDTGLAYPGYETLMKTTQLSKPSISKALEELVEKGWISIQRRVNKSNIYRINNFKLVNPTSIQKRKEYSETMKKAMAGKHSGGQRGLPPENPEMVVNDTDHGGQRGLPSVVNVANSNNTYYSILTVNTNRDLKIKNLEDEIIEVALKENTEENRKLLYSLAQSLREEKYRKSIGLP